MKKKIIILALSLIIIATCLSGCFPSNPDNTKVEIKDGYTDLTYIFTHGSGTESDPYIVNTPSDLAALSQGRNLYHKLGQDIALDNFNNITIGSATPQWKMIDKYNGILDGSNYSITGLSFFNLTGSQAFINENNGTIKNLNFNVKLNLTNADSCGIVAVTNNGTISNCMVTGEVILNNTKSIGGVANTNIGTISKTTVNLKITASGINSRLYGGIVENNKGQIVESAVHGSIIVNDRPNTGHTRCAGGIAMCNYSTGVISKSYCDMRLIIYSNAAILWQQAAFVSGIASVNEGMISNSYFSGTLCGDGYDSYVAGISSYCSGFLEYSYSAATNIISDGHMGVTVKTALFIAKDSNDAQIIRSKYCYFDSKLGCNEIKADKAFGDINLKEPKLFVNWDKTIWTFVEGKNPTLTGVK